VSQWNIELHTLDAVHATWSNAAMGTTIIDSRIFGNLLAADAMRQGWSDQKRTAQYRGIG